MSRSIISDCKMASENGRKVAMEKVLPCNYDKHESLDKSIKKGIEGYKIMRYKLEKSSGNVKIYKSERMEMILPIYQDWEYDYYISVGVYSYKYDLDNEFEGIDYERKGYEIKGLDYGIEGLDYGIDGISIFRYDSTNDDYCGDDE